MDNQKGTKKVTLAVNSVTHSTIDLYEKKHRLRIRFRIRPINGTNQAYLLTRITLNGVRCKSDFTTGIRIEARLWNTKSQMATGKGSGEINDSLQSIRKDLCNNFDKLRDRGLPFGPDDLRKSYTEEIPKPITLVEIGQMLIEAKERKLALKKLAPDTIRTQRDLQKRMVLVFKETKWVWPLAEIKTRQLEELEIWVTNRPGWKPNTAAKTLKYFKEVLRFGMAEGLIPTRPIVLRVTTPKTKHKALTREQLDALALRTWVGTRLESIADLFLFQCFTGLAYADMNQFRKELHLKVNSGQEVIELVRAKTPRAGDAYEVKVPLLPAAKRILEKYDYRLPVLSNQKYNGYLKAIGEMIGLRFALTSHVARKTFCTVLANEGVPIEIIAAWVGHATVKETLKTYTRFSTKTLEVSVRELGYGT